MKNLEVTTCIINRVLLQQYICLLLSEEECCDIADKMTQHKQHSQGPTTTVLHSLKLSSGKFIENLRTSLFFFLLRIFVLPLCA